MPRPEFIAWVEFYKLHPFDDFHRFYRPAALIAQSMSGTDTVSLLDWLEPEPVAYDDYTDADRRTLEAFHLKPPRKGS